MNVSSFSENSFKVECTRVSGESCPVCIESFSNIDRILKTPCAHLYHVHCLKQWLKTSLYERNVENCAMCRTTLNGLEKKLEKLEKLLCKYNNCCSLVTANKAIDEWDVVEVGYEAIIHFVELCMKNSQVLDSPQDMDTLRKKVDKILIQGIVKNQIPICDQPDTIRFEVAHEWLKLCQQGSEAFTQRSPLNKAELINYIRGNLQTGRRCGFDQRVNELGSELNRLLIQGIVKNQIPIYDQPDTIRFEVAHEWLKLCQQGSEAFTQRSPLNKAGLISYIRGNLQRGRQCGFGYQVDLLLIQLDNLETELQILNGSKQRRKRRKRRTGTRR